MSKQILCPKSLTTIGYMHLWNDECTSTVFIDADVPNIQNLNYKKRISLTVANFIKSNFHQHFQTHQFVFHHHL